MPAARTALLLGSLSACGGGPQPAERAGVAGNGAQVVADPREPRGVLLVAIDGLRADRLSGAGYDRETTPVLDGLAAEGALFDSTLAAAPMGVPAHIALLTGCDPNLARRSYRSGADPDQQLSWRVEPNHPRLALEFALADYRTLALLDADYLSPMLGIAPGFQDFERPYRTATLDRRGIERSGARLLQWVRSLDADESWFAYVHAADLLRCFAEPDPRWSTLFEAREELGWVPPVAAHAPALFALPPERWSGGLEPMAEYDLRYDGCLRRIDAALGDLLEGLRADGRLEQTTIAVVGSFGLQFGEAGMLLDHGRLSVADLRVPLVLRPAPALGEPAAGRTAGLASTVDVAPTLLDLAGIATGEFGGLSQLPVAHGTADAVRTHAFSSGGLQGGYAIFSRTAALELTFAGDSAPELTRDWFGDTLEHGDASLRRFYRWREEPFPALHNGYLDPAIEPDRADLVELGELERARVRWSSAVRERQQSLARRGAPQTEPRGAPQTTTRGAPETMNP